MHSKTSSLIYELTSKYLLLQFKCRLVLQNSAIIDEKSLMRLIIDDHCYVSMRRSAIDCCMELLWNYCRIIILRLELLKYSRVIGARTKNFRERQPLCRSDLCMWLTSYLASTLSFLQFFRLELSFSFLGWQADGDAGWFAWLVHLENSFRKRVTPIFLASFLLSIPSM